MKRSIYGVLWMFPWMLSACSEPSQPAPAEKDKALLESVKAPLEKANAVEQQILDQDEAARRKIDEQSGG